MNNDKCQTCLHHDNKTSICEKSVASDCLWDGLTGYYKPKQEDNVEKVCSTCDNAGARKWTNKHCCKVYCECHNSDYLYWKLRRDYNQENKEQEMKQYKQTKICTPRNILAKLEINPCNEAKSHFTDYIIFLANVKGKTDEVTLSMDLMFSEKSFKWITGSTKRTDYLLKFGFIEEEISLKPCPFCGSEDIRKDKNVFALRCGLCDAMGKSAYTNSGAIKCWNERVINTRK